MADQRMYMAYLTLYENNFHVLHWKLAGPEFHKTHERFGDYYDKMIDLMDETAEQIMTCGQQPVSMSEALQMLQFGDGNAIVIDPNMDYSNDAADRAAMQMFTQLHTMAAELADADDDELPIDVSDVYLGHAKYFRIEGLYKLARKLLTPTAPAADNM